MWRGSNDQQLVALLVLGEKAHPLQDLPARLSQQTGRNGEELL